MVAYLGKQIFSEVIRGIKSLRTTDLTDPGKSSLYIGMGGIVKKSWLKGLIYLRTIKYYIANS